MTQQEKAQRFLALHTADSPLVLPNIWNPIGARILEARGYPAAATASAAVSAFLGYEDGEQIRRSTLIELLARIAGAVDIPVTADIERGFGVSTPDLQETIAQVIATGVVGINIEDGLPDGGALRPIDEQCVRIAAVRDTARRESIHLVINARVDCFLSDASGSPPERMEETVSRARAYLDAGADCVYPVGPGDRATLGELRDRISGPINALASPRAESMQVLRDIGINRVSFGPFLFRSCLSKFVRVVDALKDPDGGYASFSDDRLSGEDIRPYLASGREPDGNGGAVHFDY